jgi:hypothetical protein
MSKYKKPKIFFLKKMDDEIYVVVCLDPNSQINSNLWLEK